MVAIVGTTVIGLIGGAVASRNTGIYFLMITLTYSVIATYTLGQVTKISGFSGIGGINSYTPGWIGNILAHPNRLYYIALGTAVVVYVLIRYIVRTPFGVSLQGVRDEPIRMSSLGYAVPLHRTLAFGFAAFLAALAGVLYVWWSGQIAPGNVDLPQTISLLIMAVIGGLVRIEGAWIGAFAFILMDNYISDEHAHPADRLRRHAVRRQLQHGDRGHLPGDRRRLTGWTDGSLGTDLRDQETNERRRAVPYPGGRPPESDPRSTNYLIVGSSLHENPARPRNTRVRRAPPVKRHTLRSWKSAAVVAVAVAAVAVWATSSLAASHAATVKVAIMTDCKGAFGFGYELDIGGAQAAFAQYAHGKPTNRAKPSAGMTNISVNGTPVQIVGYGCGNDTVPVAVTETKRLMEKLGADVMVGPLSGDEAVYVANYAKAHPTKTFIIGTAGSRGPDDADPPGQPVPLPRRRRPVERGRRRDRVQEARLEEGRDHHGRLQLRLDVRARA